MPKFTRTPSVDVLVAAALIAASSFAASGCKTRKASSDSSAKGDLGAEAGPRKVWIWNNKADAVVCTATCKGELTRDNCTEGVKAVSQDVFRTLVNEAPRLTSPAKTKLTNLVLVDEQARRVKAEEVQLSEAVVGLADRMAAMGVAGCGREIEATDDMFTTVQNSIAADAPPTSGGSGAPFAVVKFDEQRLRQADGQSLVCKTRGGGPITSPYVEFYPVSSRGLEQTWNRLWIQTGVAGKLETTLTRQIDIFAPDAPRPNPNNRFSDSPGDPKAIDLSVFSFDKAPYHRFDIKLGFSGGSYSGQLRDLGSASLPGGGVTELVDCNLRDVGSTMIEHERDYAAAQEATGVGLELGCLGETKGEEITHVTIYPLIRALASDAGMVLVTKMEHAEDRLEDAFEIVPTDSIFFGEPKTPDGLSIVVNGHKRVNERSNVKLSLRQFDDGSFNGELLDEHDGRVVRTELTLCRFGQLTGRSIEHFGAALGPKGPNR
jgi:hypothetical protein